jgi:hypothetical protein
MVGLPFFDKMVGGTQKGVMSAVHLTDDAVEPYYLL